MGDFLDAATKTLRARKEPLGPKELTEFAISSGWLDSDGATPHHTMRARLSDDILRHGVESVFMRTESGKFALREWDGLVEYVADRYQKALLDENAVVFDADLLSKYVPHDGLCPSSIDTGRQLLEDCRAMPRRDAEEDTSVIQLVSGFVIRFRGSILTYKRTKRLPESRLHGEYSVLFGGHLTPGDISPTEDPADAAFGLFNVFDPEDGYLFLSRELNEEVRLADKRPAFSYRGLLYDTSRDVSRQHLGIVYDVELQDSTYAIGERGFLMDDKFETLEQISARRDCFENWSGIIIDDDLVALTSNASP